MLPTGNCREPFCDYLATACVYQKLRKLTSFSKFYPAFSSIAWFTAASLGALLKIRLGISRIGDFLVYRQSFLHALGRQPLYTQYPREHLGSFLYGPSFAALIAPFAVMPVFTGAFLWDVFNAGVLWLAVMQLPLTRSGKGMMLVICLVEMMTCIENFEINCLVAALVLFSWTFLTRRKTALAAACVALGCMIKIYGIVGLTFVIFSENRKRFAAFFVLWMLILFFLPVTFTSPGFVAHAYGDWFETLVRKNSANLGSLMQNISVQGLFQRVLAFHVPELAMAAAAALLSLLPLFRRSCYRSSRFQLSYVAALLIGMVIFSTSSESPSYIIAVTGAALWFLVQPRSSPVAVAMILYVIIGTSLVSTDLFPADVRTHFIIRYALKALPCFVLWLWCMAQLLGSRFPGGEPPGPYGTDPVVKGRRVLYGF